jgi:hypothetical protein
VNSRAPDDLSQRDLSDLRIEQMSAAERAEMRKRYEAFVRAFRRPSPLPDDPTAPAASPRRWQPPKAP